MSIVDAIKGFGQITLSTKVAPFVVWTGYAAVELNPSSSKAEAKRYTNAGDKIVSASRVTESIQELKLTTETPGLDSFALQMGELPAIATSIVVPYVEEFTMPLTTPFEVTLSKTAINPATAGQIIVSVIQDGAWNTVSGAKKLSAIPLITSGTPAAYQLAITTTSGVTKLSGDSSLAGMPFIVKYYRTLTNVPVVGAGEASSTSIASLEFFMEMSSTAGHLYDVLGKSVTLSSSGLALKSDDVTKQEFTLTPGVAAGERQPIKIIQAYAP